MCVVFVCACVHVCMYITEAHKSAAGVCCLFVCMCVGVGVGVYRNVYHTHTGGLQVCVCLFVCVYVHIDIRNMCMCVFMHVCIYMQQSKFSIFVDTRLHSKKYIHVENQANT